MQEWIFFQSLAALVIGYFVDLLIGDPFGKWHPICLIGNLISALEKKIRPIFPSDEKGEIRAGRTVVLLVLILSAFVPFLILWITHQIHWIFGFVVECYMDYSILATRSLKTESTKVQTALETRGIEGGRYAVSMIVGRDTASLSETGVIKATVETIAENTSDGIIAPMFYTAIGGPVFGFFYKAVNTMDSMLGYKNEKYLYFGRAAAKLDDVMNYIPSRLSAQLMIFATRFVGLNAKKARQIYRRDRRNHASPNSAQTESVMAGALEVQLAGDAWYFGKKHEKPTIGDDIRPIEAMDITRANRLLYASSFWSLMLFAGIRFLIQWAIYTG